MEDASTRYGGCLRLSTQRLMKIAEKSISLSPAAPSARAPGDTVRSREVRGGVEGARTGGNLL